MGGAQFAGGDLVLLAEQDRSRWTGRSPRGPPCWTGRSRRGRSASWPPGGDRRRPRGRRPPPRPPTGPGSSGCTTCWPGPSCRWSSQLVVAVAMRDGPASGLALVDAILARGLTATTWPTPPGPTCCAGWGGPRTRSPPTGAPSTWLARNPSGASSSNGWMSRAARREGEVGRAVAAPVVADSWAARRRPGCPGVGGGRPVARSVVTAPRRSARPARTLSRYWPLVASAAQGGPQAQVPVAGRPRLASSRVMRSWPRLTVAGDRQGGPVVGGQGLHRGQFGPVGAQVQLQLDRDPARAGRWRPRPSPGGPLGLAPGRAGRSQGRSW